MYYFTSKESDEKFIFKNKKHSSQFILYKEIALITNYAVKN